MKQNFQVFCYWRCNLSLPYSSGLWRDTSKSNGFVFDASTMSVPQDLENAKEKSSLGERLADHAGCDYSLIQCVLWLQNTKVLAGLHAFAHPRICLKIDTEIRHFLCPQGFWIPCRTQAPAVIRWTEESICWAIIGLNIQGKIPELWKWNNANIWQGFLLDGIRPMCCTENKCAWFSICYSVL